MGDWSEVVLRVLGVIPHTAGELMYIVLLAAVAFLVFLSVQAHGVIPEVDDGGKDPLD